MRAIVVVGHGAPPSDAPRELVARLKSLEARRRASRAPASDEERELDQKLRTWPRTPTSDPYVGGVESLAAAVQALAPDANVVVAYNELCAPSLEEAVEALHERGFRSIDVVPTMLTKGGVHSEVEIPESIEALRRRLPDVALHYAWPFEPSAIAKLLLETLERTRPRPA